MSTGTRSPVTRAHAVRPNGVKEARGGPLSRRLAGGAGGGGPGRAWRSSRVWSRRCSPTGRCGGLRTTSRSGHVSARYSTPNGASRSRCSTRIVETFGSPSSLRSNVARPFRPDPVSVTVRSIRMPRSEHIVSTRPPGLPFQVGLLVMRADPAVRHHDTGLHDRRVDQDRAGRQLPSRHRKRPGVEPVQRGAVRDAVLLGSHIQPSRAFSVQTILIPRRWMELSCRLTIVWVSRSTRSWISTS